MKIYKTQNEVERDIKDNVLALDESVEFQCSINIKASLQIEGNINARNINAKDINAWDISAKDINAWDINAGDINAKDINASYILYYAFCVVYNSIKCISIKGRRVGYAEPIALDGKIEFKK